MWMCSLCSHIWQYLCNICAAGRLQITRSTESLPYSHDCAFCPPPPIWEIWEIWEIWKYGKWFINLHTEVVERDIFEWISQKRTTLVEDWHWSGRTAKGQFQIIFLPLFSNMLEMTHVVRVKFNIERCCGARGGLALIQCHYLSLILILWGRGSLRLSGGAANYKTCTYLVRRVCRISYWNVLYFNVCGEPWPSYSKGILCSFFLFKLCLLRSLQSRQEQRCRGRGNWEATEIHRFGREARMTAPRQTSKQLTWRNW